MGQFNTYVINIDGAFFDSNGVLKDGVSEFFERIVSEEYNIIFVTRGNEKNAREQILKLNDALYSKSIEPIFPSYTLCYDGAVVQIGNSSQISAKPLNDLTSMVKGVIALDKEATFKFYTVRKLAYLHPNKNIKSVLARLKSSISSRNELVLYDVDQIFDFLGRNSIIRVEVHCSSPESQKLVANGIAKYSNLSITNDDGVFTMIKQSKKDNLASLLGSNLSNVVYIGSSKSDIYAMQSCGLSLGIGEDLDVLRSADYAISSLSQVGEAIDGVEDKNTAIINVIKSKSALIIKNLISAENNTQNTYLQKLIKKNKTNNVEIDK